MGTQKREKREEREKEGMVGRVGMYFFQGTDKLSRQKKMSQNHHIVPYCTAKFITLSPDPIPSLAALHTEKQVFQYAKLEIVPGYKATGCN